MSATRLPANLSAALTCAASFVAALAAGAEPAEPRANAASAPRIDRLPVPATGTDIDLANIARGFGTQLAPGSDAGPFVLIFISFGMPPQTLRRLIDQAARAHATLVLRGLHEGSLMRTAALARELIGERKVAVQIDPRAFDKYAITRTPSFVVSRDAALVLPCSNSACGAVDHYAVVAGDVTLDYALRHIARAAPQLSSAANAALRLLDR